MRKDTDRFDLELGYSDRFQRFQDLLADRVHRILLASSVYDSFILSEDGRLSESLLTEYLGLNLSDAPSITRVGFAYMLSGDSPVSNSDPFATEPTGPEDWVTDVHGHIMIVVPDPKALEGISTDHRNGGPWVMWANTPYAHLMVPVDSR